MEVLDESQNRKGKTYENARSTDTANSASPNELHYAIRRATDDRSDLEDGDGSDHDPFRGIDSQELAEPEDEGGLGEDEGTRDPSLLVERVEVGGDPRKRSREDGLVESDQEDRQKNGTEHDSQLFCSGESKGSAFWCGRSYLGKARRDWRGEEVTVCQSIDQERTPRNLLPRRIRDGSCLRPPCCGSSGAAT